MAALAASSRPCKPSASLRRDPADPAYEGAGCRGGVATMNSIGDGGEPGAGAVGERTRRASGDGPPDPAGTVGAAGGEDDAIA